MIQLFDFIYFRMSEFLEKTSRQHQLDGLFPGSHYALQVHKILSLVLIIPVVIDLIRRVADAICKSPKNIHNNIISIGDSP